jgi:hypothetical protein
MKTGSLHFRILTALAEFRDGRAGYHAVMHKVWPHDKFPRAYRHSANGGPPGVAMVYGRAIGELHELGLISRMTVFVGREDAEHWGQPDLFLLSTGRKALRECKCG